MDTILTILLYAGGLLLIALFKSISKSGKKHTDKVPSVFGNMQNRVQTVPFMQKNPLVIKSEQEKRLRDSNVLNATRTIIQEDIPNTENHSINLDYSSNIDASEREETFILGTFDARAAIIYSEIFKRPDY
jgi:hypothetical protein